MLLFLVIATVSLFTIFGILPGLAFLVFIAIGQIPRKALSPVERTPNLKDSSYVSYATTIKSTKSEKMPLWRRVFPVHKISRNHIMFRIQVSAGFFYFVASILVAIETGYVDNSLDTDLCSRIWSLIVFFALCFEASVLWLLLFRASIFAQSSSIFQKSLKHVRRYLIGYSVVLPISGLLAAKGSIVYGGIGLQATEHYCHLSLNQVQVITYLVIESFTEVGLLLLFLLPLRQIVTEEKQMYVTQSAFEGQNGLDRIQEMEITGKKGFSVSIFLLIVNMLTAIAFVLQDLGWIAEFIGSSLISLMFFMIVFTTRNSWEREQPVTAQSHADVAKSLLEASPDERRINI
jgi:hypothetical protein